MRTLYWLPIILLLIAQIGISPAQSLRQDMRGFHPPAHLEYQIDLPTAATPLEVREDRFSLRSANMWQAGSTWSFDTLKGLNIGAEGWAGIVWTGTEFWASQWFNDSLVRMSETGEILEAMTIPGISQTRGMTYDGQYIWTANTSSTLRAFDPTTQTIVSAMSVPGGQTARFVSYDPDADGGDGGFYLGDFGSDILLLSKGGSLLATIPYAQHQRPGIYGLTVDRSSPDGPYLWAFDQAEWPSFATIVQLDATTGTYTGFQFDVSADQARLFASAGGLTLQTINGETWLTGILQDDISSLASYRLDYVLPNQDAAVQWAQPWPAYRLMPFSQARYQFNTQIGNPGSQSISSFTSDISVQNPAGQSIFSESASHSNLMAGAFTHHISNPWRPADTGAHTLLIQANATPDPFSYNDQLIRSFQVSDSTFARDNGASAFGLSLNAAPGQVSRIGYSFDIDTVDFLTSIEFELVLPEAGTELIAQVYAVDTATNQPGELLAISEAYTVKPEDQLGAWVRVPMTNGPLGILANRYLVVVQQPGGKGLSLGMSRSRFEAGRVWVQNPGINSGNWTLAEDPDVGLDFVPRIYANFGRCAPEYMYHDVTVTDATSNSNGSASVSVSNGVPPYQYQWDDPQGQSTAMAVGLEGGRTYTCTVQDDRGCTIYAEARVNGGVTSINPSVRQHTDISIRPLELPGAYKAQIQLAQKQRIWVSIYDLQGREIQHLGTQEGLAPSFEWSMLAWPRGVYMLRVEGEAGVLGSRLWVR